MTRLCTIPSQSEQAQEVSSRAVSAQESLYEHKHLPELVVASSELLSCQTRASHSFAGDSDAG